MATHENFVTDAKNNSKSRNIFLRKRNINKKNKELSKSKRLMEGVGVWTSFYRANPHRFVKEYLGINLKLFQQILIFAMMHSFYFMYIASRGQGKTFLTAIYVCVRAILFPESKIVIAAGRRSQSREVIEKINEIYQMSPGLKREISELSLSTNDPRVEFHGGSWIRTVTANDGARSKRANVLVVDEFRMVDESVITTVLRKFLTAERQPGYLDKPEYKHLEERNQELYLSSAWYKFHWSYEKFVTYVKSMARGRNYFVAGLPYQLAIKERLLNKNQVSDEMSESTFNRTEFQMEMECLFLGETDKAYFNLQDLIKNRKIPQALYPKSMYELLPSSFKPGRKKKDEIRLLSCDIASMGGSKNDASVYSVIRLLPTKSSYVRNVSYMESMEGGHTETQALRIKELFDEFDCDYVVLDTQGVGLGVYDLLTTPLVDRDRGIEYEPWTCINDEDMEKRCVYPNALKIIYSMKANSRLNSEIAISLKDGLRRNKVRLLAEESDGKSNLRDVKGFFDLPEELKVDLEMPFIQTTLLVNEMINLENEVNADTGLIKIKEKSTGRKDRYSSVSYGNYVANLLERKNLKKQVQSSYDDWMFFMKSGF